MPITINAIDSVSVNGGEPGSLAAAIRLTSKTLTNQQWQLALDAWVQTLNVARDERVAEARTEEQAAKAAALEAAETAKVEALAAKDAELAAKDAAHTEALAAKDTEKAAALAAITAEKDAIIAAKQSEIDALTPAPVPDGVTVQTPLQILDKITIEEYSGIIAAAQAYPAVALWLDKFRAASEVRSDDPRTIEGITGLVQYGLLTTERATELFGVTL